MPRTLFRRSRLACCSRRARACSRAASRRSFFVCRPLPGLGVVLYTGDSQRVGEDELRAAGVRALLQKPVEADALYEVLRNNL